MEVSELQNFELAVLIYFQVAFIALVEVWQLRLAPGGIVYAFLVRTIAVLKAIVIVASGRGIRDWLSLQEFFCRRSFSEDCGTEQTFNKIHFNDFLF